MDKTTKIKKIQIASKLIKRYSNSVVITEIH